VLKVLHVQVPHRDRNVADVVWDYLREDALDGGTRLRLRQNGVRVGVGNAEWWGAVQQALDGIEGTRSLVTSPVRLPPGYPLSLELDEGPREQHLFFMASDGVLTGESWPQSRNVLRVSYEVNVEHPEHVRLMVVPEVRQHLEGWRWVRNEAGLTREPNVNGRAFGVVGFLADLRPGEFLLVAPGEQAEVYGLVGNAFLSREEQGCRYDSYVFLRADVSHVVQRH
jgi:hypothetical protein